MAYFKLEKINELLKDCSVVTGQRVGLIDKDLNDVYITVEHCKFCSLVRSTEKGYQRCIESDARAIEQAKKKKELIIYRCHAGIIEACAPIFDNQEYLGSIFLGQMLYKDRYNEQCANIEILASDLFEDVSEIREAVSEIKQLDKNYLVSAANIMVACANSIVYEQLLKFIQGDNWHKLKEYIKNNYDQNITLEKISEALSLSVPTLCKVAKANSEKTIGQLIIETRMEQAKNLLTNTSMPISEVSRKVGIDDYSYFSRIFKKYTGFTPTLWRKSIEKTE